MMIAVSGLLVSRDFGDDDRRVGVVGVAELRRSFRELTRSCVFARKPFFSTQFHALHDHGQGAQKRRRDADKPEAEPFAAVKPFVSAHAGLDERFASRIARNERSAFLFRQPQCSPFERHVAVAHFMERVDGFVTPFNQRVVGWIEVGVDVGHDSLTRIACWLVIHEQLLLLVVYEREADNHAMHGGDALCLV